MMLIPTVIILLMLLLTGLFVAAEFGTVNARRTRINQLAAQSSPSARTLLPILENNQRLDRFVVACQMGIALSTLILGAYSQEALATPLASRLAQLFGNALAAETAASLGKALAVIAVLAFIGALHIILGELFAKSLAVQRPERVALAVVWPMRVLQLILALPIRLFMGSANLILRLLGRDPREFIGRVRSPEEIEMLVTTSHQGGLLDDNERRLLRNALRMRELTARQVMVHRTRIVAATTDTAPLDLMRMAIDAGFSRIPLYRETIDEIAGFVHVKDVFRLYNEGIGEMSSIIRDVVYVPETLSINDVWDQLDLQNRYLAIVFDEFGGTAGLLTLEDLIEEIFGELQDEFDDEAAVMARDKEGRIYLRGDLLVSDVNEYLELDLPEDAADTLSGLIFSLLGRPPVAGDEVRIGEVAVRVETMEDLGVGRLSLLLPLNDTTEHFTEWDVADHD